VPQTGCTSKVKRVNSQCFSTAAAITALQPERTRVTALWLPPKQGVEAVPEYLRYHIMVSCFLVVVAGAWHARASSNDHQPLCPRHHVSPEDSCSTAVLALYSINSNLSTHGCSTAVPSKQCSRVQEQSGSHGPRPAALLPSVRTSFVPASWCSAGYGVTCLLCNTVAS
jgi:hypothetical protein